MTDNESDLGSPTKRWKDVYVTNIDGYVPTSLTTTTPTASSIPIADSGGKIADGWVPDTIARLASPALTGSPTAPTQVVSDDSTKIATTAFVKDVVADYAPLESPALTGSPTAPTQAVDDDSTKIATTKFVKDQAYFNKANILGTVSQSDGIPTGAVIERGSNANGEYVKFADGTLLMSCPVTTLGANNGSLGTDFTLPIRLSATAGSAAATSINLTSSALATRITEVSIKSATTFNAKVMNIASTGDLSAASNTFLPIFVYGRWF